MTGGFQDASTHRQCLVRNSVTMLELRTGVNIPHLESFRHPDATTQQTAQDPINLTLHGCLIHESYRVPGRNSISYLCSSCELSVRGGTVAFVDETPVKSEIDGILRGLLRSGIRVTEGFKVGDVDPRAQFQHCHTVSDKALSVGGGVLEAAGHLLGVFRVRG